MKHRTRLLLVGAAIVLPLGLGMWARSAASWRPRIVAHLSDAFLIKDAVHGPWMCISKNEALNLESGNRAISPTGFEDNQPHFSPDDRSFAVVSEKEGHPNYIDWRECHSGRLLRRFDKFDNNHEPTSLQFSPDGTQLLVLTSYGVEILPLDGSTPHHSRIPRMEAQRCLSSDGKWICFESYPYGLKHELNIYNVTTGQLERSMRHEREAVYGGSFSPDSSLLCFADGDGPGGDKGAWIGDAKTGAKLWDIQWLEPTFRFSPDNHTILLFDDNAPSSRLELRAARTGKLLRVFKLAAPIQQAEFSSDGSYIYAIDDKATVWKIRVR